MEPSMAILVEDETDDPVVGLQRDLLEPDPEEVP